MIRAQAKGGFDLFARRLARKAAIIAAAAASSRQLAQKDDPARWRRADLLWPFFTRG